MKKSQTAKHFTIVLMAALVLAVILGIFVTRNLPSVRQEQTAKKILTNLLNAPNAELMAAYDSMFDSAESSSQTSKAYTNGSSSLTVLDSEEIREVISGMLEGKGADEFIESCILGNEIMTLQQYTVMGGVESQLQELTVKKSQQINTLTYDAVLAMKSGDKDNVAVNVSGQVQFDENGWVSAMTLKSRELAAFYEGLHE